MNKVIAMAHDNLIEAQVRATYHSNKGHRKEIPYDVGPLVYLSTKNLSLPKGCARKPAPKFIGPFKVLSAAPDMSNYTLDLPQELVRWRIHPTFDSLLLRAHETNDNILFPSGEVQRFYDFSMPDNQEWSRDGGITHQGGRQTSAHQLFALPATSSDTHAAPTCLNSWTYQDACNHAKPDDLASKNILWSCQLSVKRTTAFHNRVWVPGLDWPIPPDPQYPCAPPPIRSLPRPPIDTRGLYESCKYDEYYTMPCHLPGFAETRSQPAPSPRGPFSLSRGQELNPYPGQSTEFRGPVVDHESQLLRDGQWFVPRAPYRTGVPSSQHTSSTPLDRCADYIPLTEPRHHRREAPHGHDVDRPNARGEHYDQRPQPSSEHELRERALRSKLVHSSVTATHVVPLVENAAMNTEGYPIFPLSAPSNDDESDYGGSDADASGEEGDRARKDITNKERIRLEDARLNRSTRPTPDELPFPPVTAGLWGRLRFDSVERAKLIIQWWRV
ncbi:hypothetical protein K438DRAFT_1784063 [Mycena galopus ATCC 62051]|nr:hypothetical protein K438DRAFT_1784063 [Mycena galopus ATCC 62051]